MAQNFNIVAKLIVQGPNNIRQIVRSIQGQINSINANVNITVANNLTARLNGLNTSLQRINTTLIDVSNNAANANAAITSLANALGNFRRLASQINVAPRIQAAGNAAQAAAGSMQQFGEQAGLAIRRFSAFAVPTTILLGLITLIKEGVSEAVEFEKEMIRLSQVTGRSVAALSDLSGEITRLSTSLGTSSKDLGNVATTLAQAGLSAKDTKLALEALARSSLAATFTSIEDTTEGAIAVFRQFNVEASDLQGVIGSLNSVSAQFAVESDDLVSVIRRTGGAFKASGGNLNELLGLFTSVRATTRESADSIATGFRTIFTRVQRPRTIQFLRELGVELQDAKGQFIGPVESIRRLNAALSEIPSTDPRFAAVIEELGGFRQVSKVIPLIQQFPEALKAISVAEQGQQSIVEDSVTAQKSLANQIVKVKEEFLALFRELTSDKSFQFFVKSVLELSKGLIEVARAIKPLIPLIGAIGLAQFGKGIGGLAGGFANSLAGRKKFARGGLVTGGSGKRDDVPAALKGGEYVVSQQGVNATGIDTLNRINRGEMMTAATGGRIPGYADGGEFKFVVAGLNPKGKGKNRTKKTEIGYNAKYTDKYTKREKTQKVDIITAPISEPTSSQIQDIINSKIYSGAFAGASLLKSQIKDSSKTDGTKIEGIMKKAGSDAIAGSLFEGMLALAGAPYDEKVNDKDPIDFTKGVGNLGPLFGLSPQEAQYKADAKRSADSTDFKRRNLANYLKNNYSVEPGADAAKNPLKSKKQLTKSIIPSTKSAITDDSIQSAIASLNDNQIKLLQSSVTDKKFDKPAYERAFPGTGLQHISKTKIAEQLAKRQPQKLADGGEIFGGSGQKDDVNALVMGGEYVISKEAAQKFGYNKLDAINEGKMMTAADGGKIQHFANGGRVQRFSTGGRNRNNGSITSGGENIGFAVSGVASLVTSFVKLDGSTQKLINSFTAIAATASVVSLGIRGLANERTLRVLSASNGINGPTGSKGFNNIIGGAARNFEKVSNVASLASSALIIFGQHLQDSALSAAKLAKNEKDLDKAKLTDARGTIASGAGIGAGVGAAIGTVIAPGIGTAIGAGVGVLTGAIVGGFNTNNKELNKVFKQAKFDKTGADIESLFEEFYSGRSGLSSSATKIAAKSAIQLNEVKSTTDDGQRGELKKQLDNQLVNYRTLSTSIIQNVSSMNEFKNSFGGAGSQLIKSIAYLTGTTLKKAESAIQKEIDARLIAVKAHEEQLKANAQIKKFTVGISLLSEAISNVAERLGQFDNVVESVSSIIDATSLSPKFNSIQGDFFSRAASGKINDPAKVESAINNITASLDADSITKIKENAIGVSKLTNALPSILSQVADSVSLGADEGGAESKFNAIINNLSGIPDDIKNVAKTIFSTELASREASGESGLKKVVREDVLSLANKLVPEAIVASLGELDKVTQTFQNIIKNVSDNLQKYSNIQLSIAKQRIEAEDKIYELAKFRLASGKEPTLSDVQANVNKKRNILLEGTGLNSGASSSTSARRLIELTNLRNQAQVDINKESGTENQGKALKNFDSYNTQIQRVTAYLKELGSSTEELTFLQGELAKVEADKASGKTLLQRLLFGGGKGRVEFNQFAQDANDVAKGNKNIQDLPQPRIDAILNILKELPQNQKSGLLGGKTPEEFLNEITRKATGGRAEFEGLNDAEKAQAAEKAGGLTTRTKEEEAVRKKIDEVQQKAINAQLDLITANNSVADQLRILNTHTLSNFAKLFKNEVLNASILAEESKKLGQDKNASEAGVKLDAVAKISQTLKTSQENVQSAGNVVLANQGRFSKINQLTEEKKEINSTKDIGKGLVKGVAKSSIKDNVDKLNTSGGKLARAFSSGGLGEEISNDIASRALNVLGRGEDAALQTDLKKELEGLSFKQSILNDNKSTKFEKTSDKNYVVTDNLDSISGAVDAFIKEFISKRDSNKIKDIDSQIVAERKAIDNKFKEFAPSQNDRSSIINNLLDPKVFETFVQQFTLANKPIGDLRANFTTLSNEANATALSIQALKDKIQIITEPNLAIPVPAETRAGGGLIGGKGSINSAMTAFVPKGKDKVPAMLSKGEFVIKEASARKNMSLLKEINAKGYASGGLVGRNRGKLPNTEGLSARESDEIDLSQQEFIDLYGELPSEDARRALLPENARAKVGEGVGLFGLTQAQIDYRDRKNTVKRAQPPVFPAAPGEQKAEERKVAAAKPTVAKPKTYAEKQYDKRRAYQKGIEAKKAKYAASSPSVTKRLADRKKNELLNKANNLAINAGGPEGVEAALNGHSNDSVAFAALSPEQKLSAQRLRQLVKSGAVKRGDIRTKTGLDDIISQNQLTEKRAESTRKYLPNTARITNPASTVKTSGGGAPISASNGGSGIDNTVAIVSAARKTANGEPLNESDNISLSNLRPRDKILYNKMVSQLSEGRINPTGTNEAPVNRPTKDVNNDVSKNGDLIIRPSSPEDRERRMKESAERIRLKKVSEQAARNPVASQPQPESNRVDPIIELIQSTIPNQQPKEVKKERSLSSGAQFLKNAIDYGMSYEEASTELRKKIDAEESVNKRIRGFAAGGPVPGAGNRDTVPALLTPGEFVLNRRAAKAAGLGSLSNFNQKFANGGPVQAGSGGGMGPMYSLSPDSIAALSTFTATFDGTIKTFGSSISGFSSAASQLSMSMNGFNSKSSELANALSAFPSEVTHTHSPITVAVNISGVEGLESSLSDKILAAVDQKLSSQRTKASDGKSPFMSK